MNIYDKQTKNLYYPNSRQFPYGRWVKFFIPLLLAFLTLFLVLLTVLTFLPIYQAFPSSLIERHIGPNSLAFFITLNSLLSALLHHFITLKLPGRFTPIIVRPLHQGNFHD